MKNVLCRNILLSVIFMIAIGCNGANSLLSSDKDSIRQVLDKVASWQINHFNFSTSGSPVHLHDYGIDSWTKATIYLGISEWAAISDNQDNYFSWLKKIPTDSNWKIPTNFKNTKYSYYYANELCMGQFYIAMYNRYKKPFMLTSTKNRVDWIISNPPVEDMNAEIKQSWTWCDALFMAPPVYVEMYRITGDKEYLNFMDILYHRTYNRLYDKQEHLFYRDDNYLTKREENGQKIFWGRGNGWVIAGLVTILKTIPEDSDLRPFYYSLFKDFLNRLIPLQSEDRFWRTSLLDA